MDSGDEEVETMSGKDFDKMKSAVWKVRGDFIE